MAQITLEQAEQLGGGTGKYFNLKQDEFKTVRFLWDKWSEVSAYAVHEVMYARQDGAKGFKTVDCPKGVDQNAECKYCAGELINSDGKLSARVGRVIIPVFNLDDNCIQYWKRSTKWVMGTLKPVLDEVANLPSIANQTFKIKRTGSGMDTTYSVTPVFNSQDNRTKVSFGELEDPFTIGIINRYGEENNQNQQQGQQGNAPTGYTQRRTTEVF